MGNQTQEKTEIIKVGAGIKEIGNGETENQGNQNCYSLGKKKKNQLLKLQPDRPRKERKDSS